MSYFHKTYYLVLVLLIFAILGTGTTLAQCDCIEIPSNCAVPLTSLNGQGFTLSGVTGGLTISSPGQELDPISWLEGLDNVTENTAILVIDSFENPETASESFHIPDLSATVGSDNDLGDAYRDRQLTHGALVFNHISALIDGALGMNSGVPDDVNGTVEWQTASNHRLVVQRVDALEYDVPTPTENVASTITQAMETLNSSATLPEQVFTRFILNMSFAILPCDIAENYLQYVASISGDPNELFEQYKEEVAAARGYYYSQLIVPNERYLHPDPLHYLIGQCTVIPTSGDTPDGIDQAKSFQDSEYEELPEVVPPIEIGCDLTTQRLVFVGSAGNSSLPFQFYPAAWEEVIGVSASEDGMLADYSNSNADIGLPGGWFSLYAYTDSSPSQLTLLSNPPIFYRGTSFSGPVASVCLALRVTTSPNCQVIHPH